MKLALSNIALSAYDHASELAQLPELGIQGLEVAPSRVWENTWHDLSSQEVSTYRQDVEQAGLIVLGLHSLIFDHPELGLFKGVKARNDTLTFFTHLSAVCRDLGGRTLIWGGGRHRGALSEEAAFEEAASFMNELVIRIEDHGTCFCFEPLGPADSDFINSVHDSIRIVEAVNHPAVRVQLDAKALVENDEIRQEIFEAAAPHLVHFHANEPGLGILGSTGAVPHQTLGDHLRTIGYDGYVSIEQRMLETANPLAGVKKSAAVLVKCYG